MQCDPCEREDLEKAISLCVLALSAAADRVRLCTERPADTICKYLG